jgi:hypothetical protein
MENTQSYYNTDVLANPAKNYNLPTIPTPKGADDVLGSIQSMYAPEIAQQNNTIAGLAEDKKTLGDRLAGVFSKFTNRGAQDEQIYQQQGVDVAKRGVDDINGQILQETNALNRKKESIFNNPLITREQATQEFNGVARESAAKQADLSVIQYVAQNKYSQAQSIADRKIQMQFENDKAQLDALKYYYEDTKNDLSKKEDQKYQLEISQKEKALGYAMDQAKTLQNTKLELLKSASSQGANSSILQGIQSAQTPEAAVSAAGQYAGDILERQLKQAQLANTYQNIQSSRLDNETKKMLLAGTTVTPGQKPVGKADPQSAAFANRAVSANSIIGNLESNFSEINAGSIIGGKLPQVLQSDDRKKFEQAKKSFATAVLRKESGAAISQTEFDDVDTIYFPQPGDSKSVLDQKANARIAAMNGLIGSAGTAYSGTYLAPKLDLSAFSVVKTPKGQIDLSTFEK